MYIVKAYRSAVGKAKRGSFKNFRSDDLAVRVIEHMMKNTPQVSPEMIDDVIVGCANPEGEQGLQMGRLISGRALGKVVPGMTVNRYCASGLETISIATGKIAAGMGDIYIAGGAESMSMIPMTGYKLAPSYETAVAQPNYLIGMGLTAEAVSGKYEVTREQQDEFAYNSHRKAAIALENGYFDKSIVPVDVTEVWVEDGQRKEKTFTMKQDEGVRTDTSVEALNKLRAVFAQGGSCLLYTSPSPRDLSTSRMPSSA